MFWMTGTIGLFFLAAPFLFGFSTHTTALLTSLVTGILVLALSLLESQSNDEETWEYWVEEFLGFLVIAAPFVLAFAEESSAMLSITILGAIMVLIAGTRLGIWRSA